MTTKIKEKTIREYLEKFSPQKINQMYETIKGALKSPKKKPSQEEKLEVIEQKIMSSFLFLSMGFDDEDMKTLKNIIEGKKVNDINSQFLQENFIFEENHQYRMPLEIQELYHYSLDANMQKEKIHLVASFYMEINGVLTITKLKELIQQSGLSITKEKLLEYLKEKNFIIQKNKIYFNEVAKCLDESINLYNLKKEEEFAIYTPMEILCLITMSGEMNFIEPIQEFFSKKIKKKNKVSEISYAIFNLIRIGYNYEQNIQDVLKEANISFNEEEQIEFDQLMKQIHHDMPSWIENGYTGCEGEDCLDSDIDFEQLSEEEQLIVYINAYLNMNGVLEIEKFRNILFENHGLSFSKTKLINLIKSIDICMMEGDYICVDGMTPQEVKKLMACKNRIGKYKIIEDIDKYIEEFEEIEENLDVLFQKFGIHPEVASTIISAMYFGGIEEETIFPILDFFKVKLSEKKKQQLLKELTVISKNMRIWILNGYKPCELSESISK